MVSRDKFEKILLFSVLFVISAALLFPFGEAKADNIVTNLSANPTFNTIQLPTTTTTISYKVLNTGSSGGNTQLGCVGNTVDVTVTINVPAGVTVDTDPLTGGLQNTIVFTQCNVFKPVIFTSSKIGRASCRERV